MVALDPHSVAAAVVVAIDVADFVAVDFVAADFVAAVVVVKNRHPSFLEINVEEKAYYELDSIVKRTV